MTAWADQPWLAVDCESTGVDPFTARIVEVACVEVAPDGSVGDDGYCVIVDPGVDIPAEAAAIHGITTERARAEGVQPADALAEVAARIFEHGHRPVVGFNLRYDWPLLVVESIRHGVEFPVMAPALDPFLLDRMCDQFRKGGRKLVQVCEHYDVALDEADAHGALADAVAAARVMRALLARYPEIAEGSLASVFLRQIQGHEVWREGFVDWKRRSSDPSFDIPAGWPIPVAAETS